jgi:hypothetical protein
MGMYKPKKINVEKLKQYLKRQEKDGEYNKLGEIIQRELLGERNLND